MSFTTKQEPHDDIVVDFTKDGGKRLTSELTHNTTTRHIDFDFSAQLDVTVAGAGIRNRGRIVAAYDEMGILSNGKVVVRVDPRVLAYVAEQSAPSAQTIRAIPNANVQAATQLAQLVRLYISQPVAADPAETAYREADTLSPLTAYVMPSKTALANLLSGGYTAALSNARVGIAQYHDQATQKLPHYSLEVEQIVADVPGANKALRVNLTTSDRLRAVHILQTGDGAECSDAINAISFKDDGYDYIDPPRPWDTFVRSLEYDFGGEAYGNGAHALMFFQQWGRLSRVFQPGVQGTNPRLLFDVQKSAGAASTQIIVTMFKLVRDVRVYAGGRRLVTDPETFRRSGAGG